MKVPLVRWTNELYRLHVEDQSIAKMRGELGQIGMEEAMQEKLSAAESDHAAVQERLNARQAELRKLELDVATLEARQQELQKRLYSGSTTNPKELSSCQAELGQTKEKLAQAETQTLEMLMAVEEVEAEAAAAEHVVEGLRQELIGIKQQKALRAAELETSVKVAEKSREKLAQGLDPELLALYERIRKERGSGVADVVAGRCGACHMELPAVSLRGIQGGEITRCTNCTRILHRV